MRVTFAILLAVFIPSCTGDDDDGDPSTYVAISELEPAYKDANCTYLTTCGIFPDKATCLTAAITGTGSFRVEANIVAAVFAGRVHYNGTNVKTCFDALAARSCDKTSESARATPFACRDIIRGTQPGGESCTIDEECISQQCSAPSSNDSCVMGQCLGDVAPTMAPAQISEPCSQSFGCVAGAYCDQSTDVCTALKAMGDTCTLATECAYGLGCIGSVGARTCGPVPTINESCATDGICRDEGSYCDFNTGLCTQVGLPTAACTSSTQCSPYYPCDINTQQCTRGPGANQPCSSSSSQRCFEADTFCDFNTSTCSTLRSNGMACDSDMECQSDFCDQNLATPLCGQPTVCF